MAHRTGLTRATARRLLLTLGELGYVSTNGRHFSLTPRVLDIGYAYLSSLNIQQIAQPFLEALSERVQRVGLGDGARRGRHRLRGPRADQADHDHLARARQPAARLLHVDGAGAAGRAAADASSPPSCPERLEPQTERTVTTRAELEAVLADVRRQGWALVDQELELGLRSLAAPLRDASGGAVAAMNVSTHAGRTTIEEIHEQFLPAVLAAARDIGDALAKR